MGVRINQNLMAATTYRHLARSGGAMSRTLERLSSGCRINRAADDASGLVISESLRSQVTGLKQAVRNTQDGVSVVQTAEGALGEIHAMLQRIRELGVQAASTGTADPAARSAAQVEVEQLLAEIDRIATTTRFGAQVLFDGTYGLPTGGVTAATHGVDPQDNPASVETVAASADGLADLQDDLNGTAETFFLSIDGGPAVEVVLDANLVGAPEATVVAALQAAIDAAVGAGEVLVDTPGGLGLFRFQRLSNDVHAAIEVTASSDGLALDIFESPAAMSGSFAAMAVMVRTDPGGADAVADLQRDFSASPETLLVSIDGAPDVTVTLDADLTGATADGIRSALQDSIDDALGAGVVTVLVDSTGPQPIFKLSTSDRVPIQVQAGVGTLFTDVFEVAGPLSADGLAYYPSVRVGYGVADTIADLQRDFSVSPETFTIALDGLAPVVVTIDANLSAATLAQVVAEVQQALDDAVGAGRVVFSAVNNTVQPVFQLAYLETAEDASVTVDAGVGSVFTDLFESGVSLAGDDSTVLEEIVTPIALMDGIADLQKNYSVTAAESFFVSLDGGPAVEVVVDADLSSADVSDVVDALQAAVDDALGAGVLEWSVNTEGPQPIFRLARTTAVLGSTLQVSAGTGTLFADVFESGAPLLGTAAAATPGVAGGFADELGDALVQGPPVAPPRNDYRAGGPHEFEVSTDGGDSWSTVTVSADWRWYTRNQIEAALDAELAAADVEAEVVSVGDGTWQVELRTADLGPRARLAVRDVSGTIYADLFGSTAPVDVLGGYGGEFQVGSHAGERITVRLDDLRTSSSTMDMAGVDVSDDADDAIGRADLAILVVSDIRGELGAVQNRFEHALASLSVAAENLSASESRIRDADIAAEVMELTRNRILQQAGVAMLAQANAVPETVLQLLEP